MKKIAHRISEYYIRRNQINIIEKEVYDYCFEILLSTVANLLILILFTLLTKKYLESIIFIMTFLLLRSAVGGYHAKTHIKCCAGLVVIYLVMIAFLAYVPELLLVIIGVPFALLSGMSIIFLSPQDSQNKPLTKIERIKYKKQSSTRLSILILTYFILIIFKRNFSAFALSYSLTAISILLWLGWYQNIKINK